MEKSLYKTFQHSCSRQLLEFNHEVGFLSTSLKKADTIKIPFIETEPIYFYGFKASKQTVFIFITRIIFTKQNH